VRGPRERPAVTPPATRRSVVRDSLGVALATGTYGVSFGAISVTGGFDVWQTCALSLLVFTGASQFAIVGVVASGGSPFAGAASALLLGSRNALYGLRLAPLLGFGGWRRTVHAHAVIDESTAMAVAQPSPELARTGFLTTGWGIFVLWNLATLLGAVGGETLGDPRTYGLDAAVGAAFLGLLWPRLSGRTEQVAALLAAALALGLVPLTTPGVPVLAAGAVAVAFGARRRADRQAGA
jgi:predicted branched-subunit amino acid permease